MNKETIIRKATQMAVRIGYAKLTREAIATKLKIFPSSVSWHCGKMSDVRAAILQYAIKHGYSAVVGQGLAAQHPIALNAPHEIRTRAAKLLAA